jgi:Animal haem peroxidase
MKKHWERRAYYLTDGQIIREPTDLFGHSNHSAEEEKPAPFKFNFMFRRPLDKRPRPIPKRPDEGMIESLMELAKKMSASPPVPNSSILSGYTYLGQFIAHEITFDKVPDPLAANFDDYRSPSVDLDSLYGIDPSNRDNNPVYDQNDRDLLSIGTTLKTKQLNYAFENDLPRKPTGEALIGDERNDENLPVAQTHVAFIKFHNQMVRFLRGQGVPADAVFDQAREQVIKAFQSIILDDFLRQIIDPEVLKDVREHGPRKFKVSEKKALYMPLEFSVAAFRFGHSLVRPTYEWNQYHSTEIVHAQAPIHHLFDQTHFSGSIGKESGHPPKKNPPKLTSDWVINWRHFFDFKDFPTYEPPHAQNKANKIDTSFGFDLTKIPGFPHQGLIDDRRLLPARNLLRGFHLGLMSGEQVARELELGKTELTPAELQLPEGLAGETPLWYYILKEAELRGQGDRLGKVGSTIVAETLVGLVDASQYSILHDKDWNPPLGRINPETNKKEIWMVDMLHFANTVDPIGQHLNSI